MNDLDFLSRFIVNIKKNYDFSYKMKGVVTPCSTQQMTDNTEIDEKSQLASESK